MDNVNQIKRNLDGIYFRVKEMRNGTMFAFQI